VTRREFCAGKPIGIDVKVKRLAKSIGILYAGALLHAWLPPVPAPPWQHEYRIVFNKPSAPVLVLHIARRSP
jgi:hypothetical protein